MKRCSKCHELKPESEYYKDKRAKDGLTCQCKKCHCQTTIRTRNEDKHRKSNREYMRRVREQSPEFVHAYERERELKRPKDEKYRARMLLNIAVRGGKIQRPLCYEKCGAVGAVYGHHADYDRPLDVEWLCAECHGERHRSVV